MKTKSTRTTRTRDNLPRGTVIPRGKHDGLVLPTLAQFKRLSLRRRTETFLSWVKTKRGSYVSSDETRCALAQFGNALGIATCTAGCSHIHEVDWLGIEDRGIEVLPNESFIHTPNWKSNRSTFSSLAKRLEQHLATT